MPTVKQFFLIVSVEKRQIVHKNKFYCRYSHSYAFHKTVVALVSWQWEIVLQPIKLQT